MRPNAIAALALACLAGFALLVWGTQDGGPVARLDAHLNAALASGQAPGAREVWLRLTHLGDAAMQWALAIAATLALAAWHGRGVALRYAVACAGSGLAIHWIKQVVARVRPPHDAALSISGASFPSGHAMGSLVVYGALLLALWPCLRPGWPRTLALAATLFVVAGVGASRVWLSVHWPSDVLAGWLLGTAWLAGVALVSSACHRR